MKQKQAVKVKKKGGIKSFIYHLLVITCFSLALSASALTVRAASGNYKITATVYSDGNNDHNAKIEIPKVTSKGKGVAAFNKKIQEYADTLKNKYLKMGKTKYYTLETTYEVMSNNADVLSIKISTTESLGGAENYSQCFTLDKKTGKILTLKALFKKNADYVSVISENIISQMKKEMKKDDSKIYNIDETAEEMGEAFTAINKAQNFYISKAGSLVIVFDEYEVAPGSMGECSFTIPKSVIRSILNTSIIKK